MTNDKCKTSCWDSGYTFAGLENGNECWCGNSIRNELSLNNGCYIKCAGPDSSNCGGLKLISIWSATYPKPTLSSFTRTTSTAIPTSTNLAWTYRGCYLDSSTRRTLANNMAVPGGRSALTVPICQSVCASSNYKYAGVQGNVPFNSAHHMC